MKPRSKSILIILRSIWIHRILRLAIGVIFIYTSFDKMVHPDRFAEILIDYEILPWFFINISAVWLPCLELLVGILIIMGIWVEANSLLLVGLCLLFIGGISFALAKGVSLHCGCFSTSTSGEARTWISLWQDILLLVGCVCLWAITLIREQNYAN